MNDYERYGDYAVTEEKKSSNVGAIIASLLIGASIGAVLSLLFAPKSGEETRQFIRRKYDDTLRGIGQQASNLRDRGAQLVEATRKVTPFARRKGQA